MRPTLLLVLWNFRQQNAATSLYKQANSLRCKTWIRIWIWTTLVNLNIFIAKIQVCWEWRLVGVVWKHSSSLFSCWNHFNAKCLTNEFDAFHVISLSNFFFLFCQLKGLCRFFSKNVSTNSEGKRVFILNIKKRIFVTHTQTHTECMKELHSYCELLLYKKMPIWMEYCLVFYFGFWCECYCCYVLCAHYNCTLWMNEWRMERLTDWVNTQHIKHKHIYVIHTHFPILIRILYGCVVAVVISLCFFFFEFAWKISPITWTIWSGLCRFVVCNHKSHTACAIKIGNQLWGF